MQVVEILEVATRCGLFLWLNHKLVRAGQSLDAPAMKGKAAEGANSSLKETATVRLD